jgi:nucleotide-binding universal stress UspA family protein
MYRRIIVPLDGSPLSEVAMSQLPNLVGTGTEVLLLRVIDPPSVELAMPVGVNPPALFVPPREMMPAPSEESTETTAMAYQAATQYLAKKVVELRNKGMTVRAVVVEETDVAPTIVATAKEEQADLVIMSTHGRSGVARWMLGSVADRVLRSCPTPLLLVRPRVVAN